MYYCDRRQDINQTKAWSLRALWTLWEAFYLSPASL